MSGICDDFDAICEFETEPKKTCEGWLIGSSCKEAGSSKPLVPVRGIEVEPMI